DEVERRGSGDLEVDAEPPGLRGKEEAPVEAGRGSAHGGPGGFGLDRHHAAAADDAREHAERDPRGRRRERDLDDRRRARPIRKRWLARAVVERIRRTTRRRRRPAAIRKAQV